MSNLKFRDCLLASTVIAGMSVFATPAFAQDTAAPADPPSPDPEAERPPAVRRP